MSRILASVALAAVFAVPALASDAKTEFGNVQIESQNLFKPSVAKSALTVPTEQKTMTFSGGNLFSTSISDPGATQTLDLNLKAPDAGSSFAAAEAAKATLTGAK